MLRARLSSEGLAGAAAADAARRAARGERNAPAARPGTDRLANEDGLEGAGASDHYEPPERGERFDDLTVDEALAGIAEGLGLEAPIDLAADLATAPMPDLAAIFAAAGSRRRRSRDVSRPLPALPP